jgi:hypothetical protein
MKHKKNDMFSWHWTDKKLKTLNDGNNGGTTYWCCSCYCIFDGKRYIDTYWSTGDNKVLDKKDIKLKFLFNLNNVIPCSKYDFKYYKSSDCYDISHSNMMRGSFYLRKGAKRSISVMKKYLRIKINDLKHDIEYKQRQLECEKEKYKNLSIKDFI